jgi:hypothetical protein
MGYFSNGTEGDMYEAQWCARCVHTADGNSCAVIYLHMLYNYDQGDKDPREVAITAILGMLIPRSKDGVYNERCAMFVRDFQCTMPLFANDATDEPRP